jgi:hypothetical protein
VRRLPDGGAVTDYPNDSCGDVEAWGLTHAQAANYHARLSTFWAKRSVHHADLAVHYANRAVQLSKVSAALAVAVVLLLLIGRLL